MEVLSVSEWAKTWKADTLTSIRKINTRTNPLFVVLPIPNKHKQYKVKTGVKNMINAAIKAYLKSS
jgi:vacuolar-type H+-ATPase subunit F/Vma7